MPEIGKNIRKWRGKRGISQDKLSKLTALSLNTVAKLELSKNPNPTIDTLTKIAKALNVNVAKLIS